MAELSGLGPWGVAPLGLAACAYVAYVFAALFPGGTLRMRVLGGGTVLLALLTAALQGLAHLGWLRPPVLWAALASLTLAAFAIRRKRGGSVDALGVRLRALAEPSSLPLLLVLVIALALASVAAYLLPVWQWDSLGYHLPFVNFVLQGGGLEGLPKDVPYLSTYPRNVELLFVAWRALLPDDRLVDFGQLPLGLLGAAAVAGCARELGARRPDAIVAGTLWLLIPAVYLQLPTNYIDVASAAYFLLAAFFLLAPTSSATLCCAGMASGLFLGSKPSAPPAAALLALLLLVAAYRARRLRLGFAAVLLAGALGLEAYAGNLLRHQNPVWPAIVELGPLRLPGTITLKELLSSGAGAQKVHGALPWRIVQSWTSLDALPAFDMRVGGLGVLFWAMALPAVYLVARRRRLLPLALAVAACATPDPAVARYILPLPGLVFAAGSAALGLFPGAHRVAMHVALAALGSLNLLYAAPGLSGEGPPLWRYVRMSWSERARAVGANGSPAAFIDARERLRAGEAAAYDRSLWLPYLMWRSDLSNRVIFIPDNWTPAQTRALLASERVRLIAAGSRGPLRSAVAHSKRAHRVLFRCKEPCVVYWQ